MTIMADDAGPRRLRVLVVEDEMVIALEIEDFLTELGYQVVGPFADVDAAVSTAAEPLDFAMLDVNVAGRPVYPVAARLQARDIPFAFLSGQAAGGLPPEWSKVPVLEKPFAREALQELAAALSLKASGRRGDP